MKLSLNQRKMKNKFRIIAVLIIGIALIFTGANIVLAEEAAAVSDTGAQKCPAMTDFFNAENKFYNAFIEMNFKNKSSDSSLLQSAIDRYSQYRKRTMAEYSKHYPVSGNYQAFEAATQTECYSELQQQLSDAKQILKNHVRITTYKKRQTALMEKYEAINSGLRKLNISFGEMKGFFKSFDSKLPKFIKDCL